MPLSLMIFQDIDNYYMLMMKHLISLGSLKNEFALHCEAFIKRLNSDRGSEYYDPKFFQSSGIIHEVTASYTSLQNGVAERKN